MSLALVSCCRFQASATHFGDAGSNTGERWRLIMATTPTLAVGSYVQYQPSQDSPRSQNPSTVESGIGVVRQMFTMKGETFYQVVWNPGDKFPKQALYRSSELSPVNQQQANDIMAKISAGTYNNPLTSGSDYQQPAIPTQAAPPAQQTPGLMTR